jgi:hypothetical protein
VQLALLVEIISMVILEAVAQVGQVTLIQQIQTVTKEQEEMVAPVGMLKKLGERLWTDLIIIQQ